LDLKIPKLFATYLGIGARVCSTPAIDRRFKTIDFFVVLDIHQMDERTRRLFFTV
jgi:putative hemolysin